jgi:hypothetical protein
MIIHEIHDLSNRHVNDIMCSGLSKITDRDIIRNYHPDYSNDSGNLFAILENGRYQKGQGKYFVIEEDGEFICSAGWNEYDLDKSTAFALTRMYTDPAHRGKYLVANNILPKTLEETSEYENVWMTVNRHNKVLYSWFVRASQNKRTALFNDWPDIYKNFKPIGEKMIYYTPQYVVELKREL